MNKLGRENSKTNQLAESENGNLGVTQGQRFFWWGAVGLMVFRFIHLSRLDFLSFRIVETVVFNMGLSIKNS